MDTHTHAEQRSATKSGTTNPQHPAPQAMEAKVFFQGSTASDPTPRRLEAEVTPVVDDQLGAALVLDINGHQTVIKASDVRMFCTILILQANGAQALANRQAA